MRAISKALSTEIGYLFKDFYEKTDSAIASKRG